MTRAEMMASLPESWNETIRLRFGVMLDSLIEHEIAERDAKLARWENAAREMVEHLCCEGCEAECQAIEGLRELIDASGIEEGAK